ncbi:MAG: hypothetical protein KDK91_24795 [Gammaproteobacteria bacterium]|nr:hypothetical protein [Gammaproteobacteria bacterium]
MNPSDVDWGYLRGALIALALSLGIGGALYFYSYDFADSASNAYRRHHARMIASRTRYQTLDEEERIIDEFLPKYRALESQGLIGREQRLDWIEKLREAARDVGLPSLRYSIAAQQEYEEGSGVSTGSFKIYASRMDLEMGLLHEGDLYAFLAQIDAKAAGRFSIKSCELKRVQPELDMSGTSANLTARCALDWLTLHKPTEAEAS